MNYTFREYFHFLQFEFNIVPGKMADETSATKHFFYCGPVQEMLGTTWFQGIWWLVGTTTSPSDQNTSLSVKICSKLTNLNIDYVLWDRTVARLVLSVSSAGVN